MKKQLFTAVLASCILFSCAACAKNEQPTTPTTTKEETTTTEATTTTEETTASEETTTTAAETTTAETTAETTAAPAKSLTLKAAYAKMNSVIGKDLETAKKTMEDFFGTTLKLEGPYTYDRINYTCAIDVTIEGVHFDNFSFAVAKKKKKVCFVGLGNSSMDQKTMKKTYESFAKKLKKIYGKPKTKTSSKTQAYQIFKKKKIEYNTGYLYNNNAHSLWINVANYSIK